MEPANIGSAGPRGGRRKTVAGARQAGGGTAGARFAVSEPWLRAINRFCIGFDTFWGPAQRCRPSACAQAIRGGPWKLAAAASGHSHNAQETEHGF